MLAYCGRPRSASFCDRFPYIEPRYARETNRGKLPGRAASIRVALATAIISQTGSCTKSVLGEKRYPSPEGVGEKDSGGGSAGRRSVPARDGRCAGQRRAGLCSPFCICLVVACSLRSPPGGRRVARAQRCLLANVAPEPKIMQSLALSADECARGRGAALLHVGAWSVWRGSGYPLGQKNCVPGLSAGIAVERCTEGGKAHE